MDVPDSIKGIDTDSPHKALPILVPTPLSFAALFPSSWRLWSPLSSPKTCSLFHLRAFAPAVHSVWAQHLPQPLRHTCTRAPRSWITSIHPSRLSLILYSLERSLSTHQSNFVPLCTLLCHFCHSIYQNL